MKKMNLCKMNWIVLAMIFFFGAWLRVYNFGEWLVFKSDQARDAIIMSRSLERGFSTLPLLGPQVGGTPFRLGPITYYFQFISGKIFGTNPESFAYPDLLWGILFLPIIFLLFRKFFSMGISLWLTALAGVSVFLITFSRFGWNPNGLPFFSAFFVYLFLKLIEEKNKKKRWWLIFSSALTLGIIFQLHLVAAIGIVVGLALFLIFQKSLSWKEIIVSIVIILIAHSPFFISEWKTEGENIKEFKKTFEKKEAVGENHNFLEKTFRAYQEGAQIMWLVSTGQTKIDPVLTRGFLIKCDKDCKKSLPYSISSMIIFFVGLLNFYQKWKKEKNEEKKRALEFLGLWAISFFILTIFLAYQLEVRFYLSMVPFLFLLLGFMAEKLFSFEKKYLKIGLVICGFLMVVLNFQATYFYLKGLSLADESAEKTRYDLRFGSEPKVTLGQLRKIAEKIENELPKNIPIIINGESGHVKALYYIIAFEKNYQSCYFRGEKQEIPGVFSRATLKMTNPEGLDSMSVLSLGTLLVELEKNGENKKASSFPDGCLNF